MVLVILALLLVLSWDGVLSYNADMKRTYDKYIENAEKLEQKGVYIDAVKQYENALRMKPENYDVAMKIVDLYDKLEKPGDYAKACQKAIKANPKEKEPYLKLLDYYLDMSVFGKANTLLNEASKELGNDPDLTERMIRLKSAYVISSVDLPPSGPLFKPSGDDMSYYKAEKEGQYGIATSGGKLIIRCEYDEIGMLNNKLIPVKKDGEYFFVDEEGYRKLVPDTAADYFGTFGDGYAPAAFGGKYGYVNNKLKEFKMEYEFTGSFANKLAAVKKDGKWGVINTSVEMVAGFEFDEILMDE